MTHPDGWQEDGGDAAPAPDGVARFFRDLRAHCDRPTWVWRCPVCEGAARITTISEPNPDRRTTLNEPCPACTGSGRTLYTQEPVRGRGKD